MVGDQTRDENRRSWAAHVTSIRERYEGGVPPLASARARFSSLQWFSQSRVWDAFHLLSAGHEEMAHQVADRVIEAAEEALSTGSFERMFRRMVPTPDGPDVEDSTFRPSALQERVQIACGTTSTLKALHYAVWFRNGNRPMDLWRQAVRAARESYELFTREYLKQVHPAAESVEGLMRDYIEAEEPASAVEVYQDHYRGKVRDAPRDRRFLTKRVDVLYVVARFALGDSAFADAAQAGIARWYGRCQDWTTLDADFLADVRLSWAFLRGRYVTGITELRLLLDNLRGY